MFNSGQPSYRTFRNIFAERTSPVVVWVGSGLSAQAGLPAWRDLRTHLQTVGLKKAHDFAQADKERLEREIHGIELIKDNWLAFERLREKLGPTTYESEIRTCLSIKGMQPPQIYAQLWALPIKGMLTLNLDRLAHQSYLATGRQQTLHHFCGNKAGSLAHVLKNPLPFLTHLHGQIEDSSSWVLTKSEIFKLLSDIPYKNFINSIFTTTTVLFIGMSADDIASGGMLHELTKSGSMTAPHFWITERKDLETDKWAEKAGIQIIRYENHSDLYDFINDLSQYMPQESTPPPIPPPVEPSSTPPPTPDELAVLPPESIRKIVNAHASNIFTKGKPTALEDYASFCKSYARALHNAWFADTTPSNNVFFGYRLLQQVGVGAFGKVYQAESPTGEPVAIKILHQDTLTNGQMLGSFRRGVRSMQILDKHKIDGMIPYKTAFELPACAIMDFVDGPNLQAAVEDQLLDDIILRLRIARDIVKIIRAGHLLPERVLHRDIRPANIMLRNFYSDMKNADVVVLDFDLSWHKDSLEKSIDLQSTTALSYVAPEQVQDIPKVSTRNALVDSFGLGMTLYFLFTGNHPRPGEYERPDWLETIVNRLNANRHNNCSWSSLPSRLGRLIAQSTKFSQPARPDTAHIQAELEKLYDAIVNFRTVKSADLWAEELLCRSFGLTGYTWDADKLRGIKITHAAGIKLILSGNETGRKIDLDLSWASHGQEETWRNLSKYLPTSMSKAVTILTQGGWTINEKVIESWSFHIRGEIWVSALQSTNEKVAQSLQKVSEQFSFK